MRWCSIDGDNYEEDPDTLVYDSHVGWVHLNAKGWHSTEDGNTWLRKTSTGFELDVVIEPGPNGVPALPGLPDVAAVDYPGDA